MTIAITYITLGILYLLACIADGQDVKPLWKRWLGCKLEGWANNLNPIDYCKHERCRNYIGLRKAKKDVRALRDELETLRTARPIPVTQTIYDMDKIESHMVIGEGELFRARMNEYEAERRGISKYMIPPRDTVDGMVEDVTRRCVEAVLKTAQTCINIEVEKERFYPEIHVVGTLYVGRKR